jgi:Tol biopolymer transport system component
MIRGHRPRWVCVARLFTPLAMATAGRLPAQVATQPLTIEDALARVTLVPPIAISADGEWVAYTLQDSRALVRRVDQPQSAHSTTGAPAGLEGSVVWVASTRTGEARRVSEDADASWGPAWSPDGGQLAFYSDRGGKARLWLWDLRTHTARQASEVTVRPLFSWEVPAWLPDGRKILVKALTVDGQPLVASHSSPSATDPIADSSSTSGSPIRVFEAWRPANGGTRSLDADLVPPLPWVDESLCDLALV